ncbi:MAG: Crp/Fnr family transcriptional regulator [Fusicatenibacter sp.]|nr:Crp/Fnr family transcriptional regulator [Fusicatenibacter sp.]
MSESTISSDILLDYLKQYYPFYDKLTPSEKQILFSCSSIVSYRKGDFLYSCEDDCLGILLVLSGSLRIFIQSGENREITLFTSHKGEVCTLSASCMMREITFDILIEAQEDSRILITSASCFKKLMASNIYVENYIYRGTTEHFSDVMWAMGQLLFTRFDQRLAGYLEDERIRTGSPVLHTTHEQIARNLGSAREVVSRMLKTFEKEGILSLSRGTITILDSGALRRICRISREIS